VLTLGQLSISDSVFLRGEDPLTTVIDGDGAFRVFLLLDTGSKPIVHINNLHIRNGNVDGNFFGGGGIAILFGVHLELHKGEEVPIVPTPPITSA
jgi:hypothetical protein